MKPVLVLDKSYLQGSSPGDIHALCDQYAVIMPGALFWELLTSSAPVRARSYAKFPQRPNPVAFIERVGKLLRYESRQHKPAIPLYSLRERLLFRFNPRLGAGTFQLTPQQQRGLAAWRREFAQECSTHQTTCATTHRWFPTIVGASGRVRRSELTMVCGQVASKGRMIRAFYGAIRRPSMPAAADLDRRWAYFRWMQVHLLATLRHIRTHGIARPPRNRQELEHDVLDMQYQIMGILAGRIATRDNNIAAVVSQLSPRAQIIR
jgi:hypothetical protein